MALPVEPLLPQEESLVGPDEEEEEGGVVPVAAQPAAPRRGQGGRGRRAKGRRHGAAANKHKGAKHKRRVLKVVLFVTCVHEESGVCVSFFGGSLSCTDSELYHSESKDACHSAVVGFHNTRPGHSQKT